MDVETLIVTFSHPLAAVQVPLLRGAIIHAAEGKDVLFHNHTEDGFRYRYPLIQYKSVGGKATIVGVGDGVEAVSRLLAEGDLSVRLGTRKVTLQTEEQSRKTTNLHASDTESYLYRIHRYFPLNQENYAKFKATDSLIARLAFIEKCLVGNILSLAKTMGVFFDSQVSATITDVAEARLYPYKKVKLLGFDLTFKTNVLLPDCIGLGKDVSLGSGTIQRIKA